MQLPSRDSESMGDTAESFSEDARRARAYSVSKNEDDAFAVVGEHAQPIDPAVGKRVVWKIDLVLIPVMFTRMNSSTLSSILSQT